ncbi:uncharacterized protein L3040_007791 [Drepanopeziza brunnea f. sp. 'multigermtubi']|uniref:Uncharacterized protein n=1 Tax=Marssonina brunnea f. sp. multigermtubi (strain MB_m1) TaxID=1072389 RepID=K1XU32_MARBU|nr:uncharacterized protein MBM_05413 [Drepanopeziza brunnea f. sp. 'multigermtubi' MB_m1]EKD16119.1 hypothetical protein MBM_05413 [Drepanopeziza brunnea f. sp. 'multigermtubi' MB_m1]KAJ5035316.1 hypothetical protein L3040_007791 [Drepanopeziza brunnea f. sp. 'multigermtubi']
MNEAASPMHRSEATHYDADSESEAREAKNLAERRNHKPSHVAPSSSQQSPLSQPANTNNKKRTSSAQEVPYFDLRKDVPSGSKVYSRNQNQVAGQYQSCANAVRSVSAFEAPKAVPRADVQQSISFASENSGAGSLLAGSSTFESPLSRKKEAPQGTILGNCYWPFKRELQINNKHLFIIF